MPVPSLPMVVQVLALPAMLDAPVGVDVPLVATPEAQPPPGPVYLSTLRLRV